MRPAFDPRQTLSVVLHERPRAMSVFVDGKEIICAGLVLSADDPLVALFPCGSCGFLECNLVEGYAAKVRRFGPYVVWLTPAGDTYTFGRDQYVEVLGPGADDLPELTADDAWHLDDPEPGGHYLGVDGRSLTSDFELAPDGPLTVFRNWPACGDEGLRPVDPPIAAQEIRPIDGGGPPIWITVVPRADGSRAAYLPGVTRARVWCAGPAIDRVIEALVGPGT